LSASVLPFAIKLAFNKINRSSFCVLVLQEGSVSALQEAHPGIILPTCPNSGTSGSKYVATAAQTAQGHMPGKREAHSGGEVQLPATVYEGQRSERCAD